ncbi:MAG TPA: AgmX/PglI C-terminal domain-containing protein [Kofleriaceae bacterium]|nr:AgmX/PglI C-terminal domain-containing protein [Kofleriaceae bacterium]
MTMYLHRALLVACVAVGCGGKHADTTPAGGGTAGGEPAEHARGGEQVPPEKMDEINRDLDRKRPIVSRCLAIAVDNKELPKNSAGKITLEIVISPAGKAEDIKIVRSTLESKTLTSCVVHHVEEIQFPELPKRYETSYTYGFEAM